MFNRLICLFSLLLPNTPPSPYLRLHTVTKFVATFVLADWDVYVMSEKAVGQDWKSSSKITFRHSAGADEYRKLNKAWLACHFVKT